MTTTATPGGVSPFERFRHIVVEGPIGVGKTSLALRLAEHFGARPVLEEPQANPFLERFYRDGARYALPAQLFFLFQRVAQLRELAQRDLFSEAVVGDFLLDKDPLFARLTLDDDELALYQQIFATLQPQAPVPDLVIYLQAQPEQLVARVRQRGIAMEADISETYLRELGETSPQLHAEIGEFARSSGVRRLLAVGDDARHAVEAFGAGATWFKDVEDLTRLIAAEIRPGVTVLVKGSRSNRLERVAEALGAGGGGAH